MTDYEGEFAPFAALMNRMPPTDFPHVVPIMVSVERPTETLKHWCEESITGPWSEGHLIRRKRSVGDWTFEVWEFHNWSFERQEDAALFKLFWL
ncbi:hypothetical protein ACLBV5_09850 [Brevundimonas sp. M1A4_2e]